MSCTKETYRIAAEEHLKRAQAHFDTGSYYLAHYLSGLAIECYLRAWIGRKNKTFYRQHAIDFLARVSQFYSIIPSQQNKDYSTFFATANLRWKCNHRYYSERQFFQEMTDIKAEFESRGDHWKEILARTMLNCAYEIYKLGEAKWNKI